jgi:6-phosphogluconolactonase
MRHHPNYKFEIFETVTELNMAAADFIISISKKSIAARSEFVISLSGGETPKQIYSLLADPAFREQLDWKRTFIFWGDERCVPLDDERNNAHQAKLMLLNKIDIPSSNLHFIPVNLSPEKAAAEYEKEIRNFFGDKPLRFDLMLLGLGENGHTASLFPKTKVLEEKNEGVKEVYVEEEKMFRVTMTARLINHSRNILFLVTGNNKAEILKTILDGPYQPENYPAQLIDPVDGDLFLYADRAAIALANI